MCVYLYTDTHTCVYNIDPRESWTVRACFRASFKWRGFIGRPGSHCGCPEAFKGSHCGCPEAFKKRKKCGLKQQPLPELEFSSGFGPDQRSTMSCVPVIETSKIERVVLFAWHYQTLQHTTTLLHTTDLLREWDLQNLASWNVCKTLPDITSQCNTLPLCITLLISCVSGTSKIRVVVILNTVKIRSSVFKINNHPLAEELGIQFWIPSSSCARVCKCVW